MSAILVAAVVILIAFLYQYQRRKHRFFSSRGIPGPKTWPFVGNMSDNWHKPWMTIAKQREKEFGKVYGIYNGLTPRLVVTDPELIKKILVQDFSHFTDRITDRFEHPIEQEMIFSLKGEEWSSWRRAATQAFTSQKLKAMMGHIQTAADHVISEVDKRIRSGDNGIEVRSMMTNFALEVTAATGLGIEMNLFEKPDPTMASIVKYEYPSFFSMTFGLILPKFIKSRIGFTYMNKEGLLASYRLLGAVVQERRKIEGQKRDFADFTHVFLNASIVKKGVTRSPTDMEIVANIMAMFVAGFDTTAILLSCTIFCLAQNQKIQRKVLQEVIEKTQNGLDYESAKEPKYMDAVFDEVLRLYPPATFTERKVSKEYTLNGAVLPVGLDILIPIYNMHHDPNNFPDPQTFDPNRFIEDPNLKESFTYLPFGRGPRNCPGMRLAILEAKVMLSHLVMEYEFLSSGQQEIDVSQTIDEMLTLPEIVVKFRDLKSVNWS